MRRVRQSERTMIVCFTWNIAAACAIAPPRFAVNVGTKSGSADEGGVMATTDKKLRTQ